MTMNKQKILEKLEEIKNLLEEEKTLVFEDHNFKINSDSWKESTVVDGEEYKVNPKKDIWEILDGEAKGEQLFTWNAAIRETAEAGKRMPTDEELTELLKAKEDIPNLVFYGFRDTNGSFGYRTTVAYLWSSAESGSSAWTRSLNSGASAVYRGADAKAYGFSVRCVKK